MFGPGLAGERRPALGAGWDSADPSERVVWAATFGWTAGCVRMPAVALALTWRKSTTRTTRAEWRRARRRVVRVYRRSRRGSRSGAATVAGVLVDVPPPAALRARAESDGGAFVQLLRVRWRCGRSGAPLVVVGAHRA